MNRIAVIAEHPLLAEVLSEALRKEGRLTVIAVPGNPEAWATQAIEQALEAADALVYAPTRPISALPWDDHARRGRPPVLLVDFLGFVGLQQALHLGARGYVGPREPYAVLIERVQAVAAGRQEFPPGEVAELRAAAHWLERETEGVRLTETEEQLVQWVAQGLAAKQIARRLSRTGEQKVSETAARSRIRRLMEKVGVSNERELAAWAGATGRYVPPTEGRRGDEESSDDEA